MTRINVTPLISTLVFLELHTYKKLQSTEKVHAYFRYSVPNLKHKMEKSEFPFVMVVTPEQMRKQRGFYILYKDRQASETFLKTNT